MGCKQWQISEIPCVYAIAAIYDHRNNIEDYVDPTFYKDTYLKAYSSMIYPIPDFRQWPNIEESKKVLSPPYKKQAGRPKKARKNGADEKEEKKERGILEESTAS